MSYLVLARKYRPDSFDSVSGQEHVTTTLANAITRDQVGHAYVFTGPRGVGKTSIARIFAKCLNCVEGPTVTPCSTCQNCKEISAGNSLAVREIDGASHNSVDNVRELIESFRTLPAPGSKYKVYIIDEVHMLSLSAFNALLKSLEEPPPHTVFILATTEPHKIPDTVMSRCQRHDLRAITLSVIGARIEAIAKEEGFSIESGAIKIIAKLAEGSMRDAQTLLERARAYSEDAITTKEVSTILGSVDVQLLIGLAQSVLAQDVAGALSRLQAVFEQGADEVVFLREFVSFFRELHIVSFCSEDQAEPFGITAEEYRDYKNLLSAVDVQDVADIADMVREGADKALRSSFPQYATESLVVRMASRPPVKDLGKMVGKLREMAASGKVLSKAPQKSEAQKKKSREQPEEPKRAVEETEEEAPASSSDRGEEFDSDSSYSVGDLVMFLNTNGASILSELLRRVSVKRFCRTSTDRGVLMFEGPAFQVQSLNQEGNRARLIESLVQFSQIKKWDITTKVSKKTGRSTSDSLEGQDSAARATKLAEKQKQILTSPSIKRVMEVFPGSKVEKIRLKRAQL